MTWNNVLTFHHRIMARFLRKRGWVVFYLEKRSRICDHKAGTCWLHLYEDQLRADGRVR